MSLLITEDAARYILMRVPKDQMPLRLVKDMRAGCGDIASQFLPGGMQGPGDTLVEGFGMSLLCDFLLCPEFEHASVELIHSGGGAFASKKVIVVPNGAHLCGCGESAAIPKS